MARRFTFTADDHDGNPRPIVPVELTYWHEPGPVRDTRTLVGLVDSGSTHVVLTAGSLPPEVPWASLRRLSAPSYLGAATAAATAIWRAQVRVLGTLVSEDVVVLEPGATERGYAILGLPLFRRFVVEFAFSNDPPFFALAPVGQFAERPAILGRSPSALLAQIEGTSEPPKALAPGRNLAIRPKRRKRG